MSMGPFALNSTTPVSAPLCSEAAHGLADSPGLPDPTGASRSESTRRDEGGWDVGMVGIVLGDDSRLGC